MSRTCRKMSRITRSCRNHTIAHHHHCCHASQRAEPALATESIQWPLWLMHISKDDAPRGNDARAPPSPDPRISGILRIKRKEVRKFYLGDAFKMETVPKEPPSPAPTTSRRKFFTRNCFRRPSCALGHLQWRGVF
jgi:hypothetical protein